MSLRERDLGLNDTRAPAAPAERRRLLLLLAAGVMLLMGFYALTDGAHLGHDPLLAGGDWVSYALCHRITERSFTINGRQFPLCARCTGMYLGVSLSVVAFLLAGRGRRAMLPSGKLFLVLLGFIVLMGIDGLNSYSHFFSNTPRLYEPQNWLRLLTGLGTGLAMGVIVMSVLAQTLWARPEYKPILENGRELLGLMFLALVGMALVLSNQPALSYVLALVSVGGLLFVLSTLNSVVLLILLRREGKLYRWQTAVLVLAIGLVLAIVETSIGSILRYNLTGTMTGFPGL
jgi:uncharacterized membrane protein